MSQQIAFPLNTSGCGFGVRVGIFPRVRVAAFRAAHKGTTPGLNSNFIWDYQERDMGDPIVLSHINWVIRLSGYGDDNSAELYFDRDECFKLFRCPYEGLLRSALGASLIVGKRDAEFRVAIELDLLSLNLNWEEATQRILGSAHPKPTKYEHTGHGYMLSSVPLGGEGNEGGALEVEFCYYNPERRPPHIYKKTSERLNVVFLLHSRNPNVIRQGMKHLYQLLFPNYSGAVENWAGSDLMTFCGDYMPSFRLENQQVIGNTGKPELFDFTVGQDGFTLWFPLGLPDWLNVENIANPNMPGTTTGLIRDHEHCKFKLPEDSASETEFVKRLERNSFEVKRANLPHRKGSLLVCTWK